MYANYFKCRNYQSFYPVYFVFITLNSSEEHET